MGGGGPKLACLPPIALGIRPLQLSPICSLCLLPYPLPQMDELSEQLNAIADYNDEVRDLRARHDMLAQQNSEACARLLVSQPPAARLWEETGLVGGFHRSPWPLLVAFISAEGCSPGCLP